MYRLCYVFFLVVKFNKLHVVAEADQDVALYVRHFLHSFNAIGLCLLG